MAKTTKENEETTKEISNTTKENAETIKEMAKTTKENAETTKEISNTTKENAETTKEMANTTKESVEMTQEKYEITPQLSVGQELEDKIIDIVIVEHDITARQIAEKLNVSFERVRYRIRRLKVEGRIKRIGSTKSGYWVVVKK